MRAPNILCLIWRNTCCRNVALKSLNALTLNKCALLCAALVPFSHGTLQIR
uniref:Uncharacterized protein n=1 Tax=Arundo donax TaxID=35708 RepID=A0A0A8YVA7_ARUDO